MVGALHRGYIVVHHLVLGAKVSRELCWYAGGALPQAPVLVHETSSETFSGTWMSYFIWDLE